MGKYKTSLVKGIEEQEKKKVEQEKIKARHGIQEENVIVVEKSNMVKFFVRTVSGIVRLVAKIALLVLAVIGMFTLAYPEIRMEFVKSLELVFRQSFFSFL